MATSAATTVSREYIISALRSGFSDSQIADALGVTQSAVSQLIDSHGLRETASANSRFATIDEKLNSIEEKALDGLDKQVRFVHDPMKLLKIVTGINNAKRRSLAEGKSVIQNNNVQLVQISLPQHLREEVKLNAQNQVVAVGDRDLVTIQSGKLLKEVAPNTEQLPAPGAKDETSREKTTVADYL